MENTNVQDTTTEQKTQETITEQAVEKTPTPVTNELNRGIGTKEGEKLGAAMVSVLEPKLVVVPPKEGGKNSKESKIIECVVKHPGKEDLIKVSQVRYLKNEKIDQSGLWFHEDEDFLIPKNSALAVLLRHVGVSNISGLIGKSIMTETGKNGFLAFKAY